MIDTIGHSWCLVTGQGHQMCLGLNGPSPLVWWMLVNDMLFAGAYFTVGPALYRAWRVGKLGRLGGEIGVYLAWLVGAFIVFCGGTHLLGGVTLFWPWWYTLEAIVGSAGAAVSWIATISVLVELRRGGR